MKMSKANVYHLLNSHLVLILLLLGIFITQCRGLQCHTCLFVAGVVGDTNCKHPEFLTKTKECNSYKDAMNGREMMAIQTMSPDTTFHLGCLNALIQSGDVEIVLRGCYGYDTKHSRYSSTNACESPPSSFWKQLKEGPLKNSTKPLDITKAKLEVCICRDADGCNSGGKINPIATIFLFLFAFVFSWI